MKNYVSKAGQKVSKHFGYFCKEICQQELSKIAQSGHTGSVDDIEPAKIRRSNDRQIKNPRGCSKR